MNQEKSKKELSVTKQREGKENVSYKMRKYAQRFFDVDSMRATRIDLTTYHTEKYGLLPSANIDKY